METFGALVHTSRSELTIEAIGSFVFILRWGLTIRTISGGPKVRFMPAWGNAPGMEARTRSRAEDPTHRRSLWASRAKRCQINEVRPAAQDVVVFWRRRYNMLRILLDTPFSYRVQPTNLKGVWKGLGR